MGKKKKSKKWKKKKGYKKYNNKKQHQRKHHKMGLGTKLLIGAGIAAVAVGGLYIGKKMYDQHKANERRRIQYQSGQGGGGGGSNQFKKREVVDDGPPPASVAKYLSHADPDKYTNSMDIISVPDAVTIGLGWDFDHSTDYDLLAAAYGTNGENLGFIQGTAERTSLFGKAILHTGDNDGTSNVDTVLGDSENIILDLRAVPPQCAQILFGILIITPPHDMNQCRPYVHMLPMMRPETIDAQKAAGRTREVQGSDSEDSDEEYHSSPSSSSSSYAGGTRGINDEDEDEDDRHDFIKLFHDELSQHPEMLAQKGFVAGRLFRSGAEWSFQPYRTVVASDPQYGIWPALDHYAKLSVQAPPSYYQHQPAFGSQQGYDPGYMQQGYDPGYVQQGYGQAPPGYGSNPPYY